MKPAHELGRVQQHKGVKNVSYLYKYSSNLISDVTMSLCNCQEIKKELLCHNDSLNETVAGILEQIHSYRLSLEQQPEMNILDNEQTELVSRLTREKVDSVAMIQSLSNDLEIQIDECIDLTEKMTVLSDNEAVTKTALISLIKQFSQNDTTYDQSVPELIEGLKQLLEIKDGENINKVNSHNSSILDFDELNMDNLCQLDYHGSHCTDISKDRKEMVMNDINEKDNSCFNLDVLDSELLIDNSKRILNDSTSMLDDLEQLDCDENCVENSVLICMKSVLRILDFGKNSVIETQLKKLFADYSDMMSKKLRSISDPCVDLNSTCVFEKLEQHIQTNTEIGDLKKQLAVLTEENNSLSTKMEEIIQTKEKSDCLSLSLQLQISNLTTKIDSSLQDMKDAQCNVKELDEIKKELETSLAIKQGHIECHAHKLTNLEEELKVAFNNANEWKSRTEELVNINCALEHSSAKLSAEIENLNGKLNEIEKEYHIIKDSFDAASCSLKAMEEKVVILQSDVATKNLELESTLDELIKANEELEDSSLTVAQKEEQLFQARNDAVKADKEIVCLQEEIDIIKKYLTDYQQMLLLCKADMDKHVDELNARLGELLSRQDRIEDQNKKSTMKAQITIDNLNKKYEDMERVLLVTQDEKDSMVKVIENLEIRHSKMIEEIEESVRKMQLFEESSNLQIANDAIRLYEFENQVTDFEIKSADFERVIRQHEDNLKKLNDENCSLRELNLANNDLRIQLNILETKHKETEHQLCMVLEERDKLMSYVNEFDLARMNMVGEIQSLKQELDERKSVQKEMEFMMNEFGMKDIELNDIIRCKVEQVEGLVLENDSLRKLCDSENQLNDLERKYIEIESTLIAALVDKGALQKYVSELEDIRTNMTEEIISITHELEEEKVRKSHLESEAILLELSTVSNDKSVLTLENDSLKKLCDLKEDEIHKYAQEIDKLRDENRIMIEESEGKENKNRLNEEMVCQIQIEMESVRSKVNTDLSNAETMMSDMKTKLNSLLSEKNDEIQKMQVTEEELRNVIISRNETLTVVEQELVLARQETMRFVEEERAIKNKELEIYKIEIVSMKKLIKENECENLKKQNEDLLNAQQRERVKFVNLSAQYEHYKEKIDGNKENDTKLHEEMKGLKQKLQQISADYDVLIKAYNELKERYREKRRRTDDLNNKYEKMVNYCREKGFSLSQML